MLILSLGWPPSVNHYWYTNGSRRFIGKKGIEYREHVYMRAFGLTKTKIGPLRIEIKAYPPDKRKRDLDNILKSLLDALEHAKVYENDNQINELLIKRQEIQKPGRLTITIYELNGE